MTTYIDLWAKYTTVINDDTWYITDLYDYEMDELNLTFNNNIIHIPYSGKYPNNMIYTVWMHEKIVSLLLLKFDFISHDYKIEMTSHEYQHALNVLKSQYDILPD